ncbi:MAG: thioredoxin family protein, partial [Deltaproteobacteria bacterium]|nr:thioredoxin family protein [Deltaproteobacteria bacterium]
WETDEAAAFARARREGRGVVLDVTAAWSGPSLELAHHLEDPRVVRALAKRYVPLRIDITDDEHLDLRSRYRVTSLPSLILLDAEGNVLYRITSLVDVDELVRLFRN